MKRRRRRRRRITANWACAVHAKPLIYAISMETVVALWYTSYCLFGVVLRQAYWARAVVRPRQPPALPEL